MKGDIHSYVFSTSSFLCDIRKLRYRQNNIGYQIIKIVNYRLIPYSWNMMPCIVLPVSRPPNVTEKTACTQMKGGIPRYVFSTSSPLCDIGEKRYRQNSSVSTFMVKGSSIHCLELCVTISLVWVSSIEKFICVTLVDDDDHSVRTHKESEETGSLKSYSTYI